MFTAAIIGCGKIAGLNSSKRDKAARGYTHAGAYSSHKGFKIEYAIDIDYRKARAFAKNWGIANVALDIQELLHARKFDVVSICTPDRTHYGIINTLLDSEYPPRVIFTEKPICVKESDFIKLIEKAKNSGSFILVDHSRRFDLSHRRLRSRLDRMGKMLKICGKYYGGWIHNGVHLIDTIRMITGEELVFTKLAEAKTNKKLSHDYDFNVDFSLSKSGASVNIISFPEDIYQLFELELYLTGGRIRITDFGHNIEIEKMQINKYGERELCLAERNTDALNSPLSEAVKEIGRFLNGKSTFIEEGCGLREASKTMAPVWQAISSYKKYLCEKKD